MNNNADAIMAVYPFTPHPAIIEAITSVSTIPVLAGVGGGTTQGPRSANMALFAESHGCLAVVVNAPTPIDTIEAINEVVDIPIIMTIVSEYTDIDERLAAGVDILNISNAGNTIELVKEIREKYPKLPIIATGGPTEESIKAQSKLERIQSLILRHLMANCLVRKWINIEKKRKMILKISAEFLVKLDK